jgi:hypothetical protein
MARITVGALFKAFLRRVSCFSTILAGLQCYLNITSWFLALMSMSASILVDSVGPPSAEVCRTAASFPKVDHLRFIELKEEEVKAIPLKQPCN